MENLAQLLDKLLETLQALNGVLEEEHDLLCSGQLPGVALQRVTDAKANCWRRSPTSSNNAWGGKPAGNAPPTPTMRPWPIAGSAFKLLSQTLREKNQHNGLLLNQQIDHNAQALAILSKNNKSLYGPDGQSHAGSLLGRKIGV